MTVCKRKELLGRGFLLCPSKVRCSDPLAGRTFWFQLRDATTLALLDRSPALITGRPHTTYQQRQPDWSLGCLDDHTKAWRSPDNKKTELGSKPTKRFIVDLPGTVRFAILHGLLCNKSLLKTEGWSRACCQVDTYPGGTGVATPTSSPPSIFASFIFALPPTHLLLQPQRPQIQLLPGSSGRKQLGSGQEEFRYVSIQYSRQGKSSLLWFN